MWLIQSICIALLSSLVIGCGKPASSYGPPPAPPPAEPATAPAAATPAPAAAPRPEATRASLAPSTAPATGGLATPTARVPDLRSPRGQLIFGVFTPANGFPTDATKSVNWQTKPADADSVTFTCELPPGKYGASVLHDENNNNKMDRNLAGIPEEGYGVTNNPKPAFRAARFDESTFTLPAEGATLTISVQYF